jgi:integrase
MPATRKRPRGQPGRLASINISKPGFWADGNRLYLLVRPSTSGTGVTRSWVYKYDRGGRQVHMGLGSAVVVGLAEAREIAMELSRLLAKGIDPKQHREHERARKQAEQAKAVSFEQAAASYIQAQMSRWTTVHHADWVNSLRVWVHPVIGKMSVGEITTDDVLRCLQQTVLTKTKDGEEVEGPFWDQRSVTATRVRARIETVLSWAGAQGLRSADVPNPARWRGHLQFLLAAQSKLSKPVPQPALPYLELPAFLELLAKQDDRTAALAYRFLAHVATRSADLQRAKIADIDYDAAVWKIASYSKTGRPLAIPLSPQALALAKEAAAVAPELPGGLLFPDLSNGVMNKAGWKIGFAGKMSPHGCRACFKTWASEKTSYERELIEVALGHTIGGAVEQRYMRGDMLDKRRRLMCAWSDFITGKTAATAEIVAIGAKRKRSERA